MGAVLEGRKPEAVHAGRLRGLISGRKGSSDVKICQKIMLLESRLPQREEGFRSPHCAASLQVDVRQEGRRCPAAPGSSGGR